MGPKITCNLVCPTCGTPFPLWVGCSLNFGEKAEYVCDNCCVQERCDRAIPNLTVECGGAEDAGHAGTVDSHGDSAAESIRQRPAGVDRSTLSGDWPGRGGI